MFKIILNPDFSVGEYDLENTTVSEILGSYLVCMTNFEMRWNEHSIKMNYGLHIGDSIRDIFLMISNVKMRKKQFHIQFPSQSFFETWYFSIDNNEINVKWLNKEELYGDIDVDVDLFLREWHKLFKQMMESTHKAGYNEDNITDLHMLSVLSELD